MGTSSLALFTHVQADQTSRFDQDSPGLDVMSQCPERVRSGCIYGLQKAVPIGTEGFTCDFPVSSIL